MKTCPTCMGEGVVPEPTDDRKRRVESGVSLSRVAEAMGISTSYLSDLERGSRTWSGVLARSRARESTSRPTLYLHSKCNITLELSDSIRENDYPNETETV